MEVSCKTRYRFYKHDEPSSLVVLKLRCRETKLWSEDVGHYTCRPIICPLPADIDNGEYGYEGGEFSNGIEYICHKGYELVGESRFECTLAGKWSGTAPECIPVKCTEAPLPIPNGRYVNIDSKTLGNVLPDSIHDLKNLVCDPGFRFTGPDTVVNCLWNASWSLLAGGCEATRCARPIRIAHGRVHGRNYTYSARVTYTCVRGYSLVNATSSELTCGPNRRWVGLVPRCTKNTCSPPYPVDHATPVVTTASRIYRVGERVQYRCDDGYSVATVEKTCQRNLTWSRTERACQVVECGLPPDIIHGYVSAPSLEFRALAHYTCERGYTIFDGSGSTIGVGDEALRRCSNDSRWLSDAHTGDTPTCERNPCAHPAVLPNAYISEGVASVYQYGDTVTFRCKESFSGRGSASKIICDAEGVWKQASPEKSRFYCIRRKCTNPMLPRAAHGRIVITDLSNGSQSARLHCDNGYFLPVARTIICTLTRWSDAVLPCAKVICQPLPMIANARLRAENQSVHHYGDRVRFSCDAGYLSTTTLLQATCRTDGTWTWNEDVRHCKRGKCPLPPFVAFGTTITKSATLNDLDSKILIGCKRGYVAFPVGSGLLECDETLQWKGVLPRCVEEYCPRNAQDTRVHDSRSVNTLHPASVGAKVHLSSCNPGFEYFGNSHAVCDFDLNWHWYGEGACTRRICRGAPPVTQASNTVPDKSLDLPYGAQARILCLRGYRSSLPMASRCEVHPTNENAVRWTEVNATCEPIKCGRLEESPDNGRISYTNDTLVTTTRGR